MDDIHVARQLRNCQACKKRKIKCDRKIPCGPCAIRGDVKGCTAGASQMEDGGYGDEPEAYVSTKDFKLLAQRVAQLQAKVDALEAGVVSAPGSKVKVRATSTNLDDSLATEKAEGSAPTSPLSPRTGVASRRHVGDDEMVFALEDLHFRHGVNTLRNIDASPGVGTHRLDPASMAWGGSGVVGDDAGSVQSRLTDDHPLAFLIPPDSDYLAMALHVLPDQPTCEFLVQQYFGNLEWFQRCLHYPTFFRQCQHLWAQKGSIQGTSEISPDFVVTYIMVVCLGLRTAADSLPGTSGTLALLLGTTNTLALADRLYHVAEGVLWCSRFMHRQTFESLQAISLMTVYGFGMSDGADATWALCGAAIKIGQNLGLNRLEDEGPDKQWGAVWGSRLKREMGRRVWWTFVSLDWVHAVAHGSTYAVHPSQNQTVLPANLDDEQLDDDDAEPQPLSVYTPISMQIFRHKFVTLYREITDHMASHESPSYAFIIKMDDQIINLAKSLPKHFSDPERLPEDVDQTLLLDSIFLNLTANTRLVRLHRYFFLRGYQEARYRRSKERCVQSSMAVLRLIELATRRAPVLLSSWVVLFYAFSAAVPACIDQLFEPTPEKRAALLRILETFREHSEVSPSARNSVFVMERLLEVETTFQSPAASTERPSKRRRGTETDTPAGTPPGPQGELLKTTIKNILQSAAFTHTAKAIPLTNAPQHQPLPPHTEAPSSAGGGAYTPMLFDMGPPTSGPAAQHHAVPSSYDALAPPVGDLSPLDPSDPAYPLQSLLHMGDILDTLWTQTENVWH